MTTWAPGNTITSAWMNSVENVLALGTYSSTNPRLTMAPNSTFNLVSGAVAANLRFNGSITVPASSQMEVISFRSINVDVSAANSLYTSMYYDIEVTALAPSSSVYQIFGSIVGGSGVNGKINPAYFRATANSGFGGIVDVVQIASTHMAGSTVDANSAMINMSFDGDNTSGYPFGILLGTNNAGKTVNNAICMLSTLFIGASFLQWNQRAAQPLVAFIAEYNSSGLSLFNVDSAGNINFGTTSHNITSGGFQIIGMDANGSMTLGKPSSAASDTTGYAYIQSVAGAPTGVPTDFTGTGFNAIKYDRTNHQIYVYDGGWKKTAALT